MKDFKFLEKINTSNIKKIPKKKLIILSDKIREFLCIEIPKVGGHLGSNLGTVELTVALHYVFNGKKDYFIWDTGHQTYTHKILTYRQNLSKIRQPDGLSPFTKPTESEYDKFIAGHSSCALGLAIGTSKAQEIKKENNFTIPIIGDAAMQSGVFFESLNNVSGCKNLICILNDNEMSISKSVGALNSYIAQIKQSYFYYGTKNIFDKLKTKLPKKVSYALSIPYRLIKKLYKKTNLFTDFGFEYIGAVDGHDVVKLVNLLSKIKKRKNLKKPILLHLITKKGKGFDEKTGAHSVSPKKSNSTTYSKLAAEIVTNLAQSDNTVTAITPAMEVGSCLTEFKNKFPDRFFDVGIAESASVLLACGMAEQKLKPFVFIYSTFLQRAFDQLIHDVAISSLPVRFIVDRIGFSSQDGVTHNGFHDASFVNSIPNFIIMAPSNAKDVAEMINTAYFVDYKPTLIRIPKDAIKEPFETTQSVAEIGKAKILHRGTKICIISIGFVLSEVKIAHDILKKDYNLNPTLIDLKFIKPLDIDTLRQQIAIHDNIMIIEESYIGGGSAGILKFVNSEFNNKKVQTLTLQDKFFDFNSQDKFYSLAGLDAKNIINNIKNMLNA